MGRSRTFDEAQVLERAMHAFRRRGYTRASVRCLEDATGLTVGSLYNAYGDKEGLFRAALSFYVNGFVAARVGTHAGAEATLEDLEELLLTLFREPLTDGFGCLVTNSVVEFGATRSAELGEIGRALDIVDAGIRSVLLREVGAAVTAAAAPQLSLLYQGLLVLSRAGRLDASYADAVRDQFRALRARRRQFQANSESSSREE